MLQAFLKTVIVIIIFSLSLFIHRILIRLTNLFDGETMFWISLVGIFFIILFLYYLIFSKAEQD
ncbi:protease [Bacillus sp. TS-2]|nr:protease [Bacillus sp. TS-2]